MSVQTEQLLQCTQPLTQGGGQEWLGNAVSVEGVLALEQLLCHYFFCQLNEDTHLLCTAASQ